MYISLHYNISCFRSRKLPNINIIFQPSQMICVSTNDTRRCDNYLPVDLTTDRITEVVVLRFSVHTKDACCALIRAQNWSKECVCMGITLKFQQFNFILRFLHMDLFPQIFATRWIFIQQKHSFDRNGMLLSTSFTYESLIVVILTTIQHSKCGV